MDLNQIREILREDGGKLIIIEEGREPLVIVSLDEYRKRISGAEGISYTSKQRFVTAESAIPKEFEEDELKIEDLPV